ncbi:M6 family metalloprotease domain-containing protein [Streptomyces sp. 21So2-11]|uniref:M6 family metalloprotease domain-containing protein n=1 Tax=Streptomyces sp. 21So2-11 TaxID=3144408 RepID=UPI00321A3FD5
MPPSPELGDQLKDRFQALRAQADAFLAPRLRFGETDRIGFNDGLVRPGTELPLGTSARAARRAATEARALAPLRGTIRVLVVLVEFDDKALPAHADTRFRDLFFSTGTVQHGSVKEYFSEVSNGLVNLAGEVVGPYRMPQPLAAYAGTENGTQAAEPNARTLADDALTAAAAAHVDFAPYDNDDNGYVDAFLVVHAGQGAEATGAMADIWSHKWILPAERTVAGAKVFAYLTIPQDAKIGVCAHELGHLLFSWPDLYDTDGTSEGIGNWCLMAGGSWGLGGDRPVHPSAWCKAAQGWVKTREARTNGKVTVRDVKESRIVHRLWRNGERSDEYFLVENRMRKDYDAELPGEGLLIWHIDDAATTNRDERHYKVALVQADARRDMENNVNRGDEGDAYPGSATNIAFTGSSTPNSKSYAGLPTGVAVTEIPPPDPRMTVRFQVRPGTQPHEVAQQDDLSARVAALEALLGVLGDGAGPRRPDGLPNDNGRSGRADAQNTAVQAAVTAAITVYDTLSTRQAPHGQREG